MTFFLNNQPSEPDAPESYETDASPSHSARTRPLFKQDSGLPESLPGQHISLSAYISKHLQGNEQAATPPELAPSEPGFRIINSKSAQPTDGDPSLAQGQYLNSLDVELAAGLEQYLPTPLFRMRVMKKRLDGDIAELKMRLNKYERLPEQSPELRGRINGVRARLATLEAHERQVSQDLASAMKFGTMLYGLTCQSQGVTRWLNVGFRWWRRLLTRIFYGSAYLKVEAAGEELRNLQELFAERINDKTASSGEISRILNQYEQTAHELESLAQQLKAGSLSSRLWQEARRLVK